MKKYLTNCALLLAIAFAFPAVLSAQEHKTMAIGAAAPDFKLKGVDDKTYTLQSFNKAKVLAVVFMCNHCPTSQAYEERIKKMTTDYAVKA
jgi:peroxiredoxin